MLQWLASGLSARLVFIEVTLALRLYIERIKRVELFCTSSSGVIRLTQLGSHIADARSRFERTSLLKL